jgi:phage-related protein
VQSQIQGQGVSSTAVAAIGSFGPAALGAAGSLGAMVSGLAALNIGAAVARVGQLAASAATAVWTGAQWLLNVALTANPIGLVILAIVAIVAAIVIAYKRSETFRAVIQALWAAIKAGAAAAWNALRAFGASFAGWVSSLVARGKGIIDWFRDLPGRIKGAFGRLDDILLSAGRAIISGLLRGITDRFGDVRSKLSELTNMLPDWKGPASVDMQILYGSGEMVADGFERGFVDRFQSGVRGAMGAATAGLPSAVSGSRGAGIGSGGAVHIHTPAVVTSDRQLVQLIDRAERGTARTRTFARAGA